MVEAGSNQPPLLFSMASSSFARKDLRSQPLDRKLPWKGYSLRRRNELLDILNRVTR